MSWYSPLTTTFTCPWGSHRCRTPEQHASDHPDPVALARTASALTVSCVLAQSFILSRRDRLAVFEVVLARPDRDARLERVLLNAARSAPDQNALLLETVLDAGALSRDAVKMLSRFTWFTPEALLVLLEQPRLHLDDSVNLVSNLATAHNHLELFEAFATGGEILEAATLVVRLKQQWDPGELLKTTRQTMSLLSRDRAVGLEMLRVLAKEWEGSPSDLAMTVKALL